MLTEGIAYLGPRDWRVSRSTVAGLLAAAAVGSSTIVFSEPAPTDVLMGGFIVALPILGVARLGPSARLGLSLWLAIVALGFFALSFPQVPGTATMHQVVTLFLALGSVALAGYITKDPERRFDLVMRVYVVACLAASLAALVGYFRIVPSAFELFTNYGRARGTFKDPNVFGAALLPAISYLAWHILRARDRSAIAAAAVMLPLVLGLLLSFSRGAWLATALAVSMVSWVAIVTARRRSDWRRLSLAAAVGLAAIIAVGTVATQLDEVSGLLEQRATMDQSYDQGPDGRFGGQRKAVALVLDNPLGIGTHTFRTVYHHEEPHNVYLSMFLNAGWTGGLLYIAMVGVTLFAGLRAALRPGALQGPLIIAAAAFAGIAFEGAVIDSDHWRHFFLLLGCVWGLADARASDIDTSRRRTD